MPPPESAAQRIIDTSIKGPPGEVRHVPAGSKNVPHTAARVEVSNECVTFVGPCLPGQPYEYSAPLDPHRGDVNAAIRAALEERMYGPETPTA